ncbi:MAG: tetraacyldisaccharide 4'-kinase [Gammaproteobacteria bacterium RIFCSPHIGHO2_12_FULL_43_28]|nr:MAG: tetraacyldisaccharide 4'-kinase [Gammaproteobacteria bacterium RIFCSPHIGHO2_12_FULL_43_28]
MRFDITRYWYQPSLSFLTILLLPVSWLFAAIVRIRCWLYQKQWLLREYFSVPVIVVGNITVGGTGKTPCVLALTAWLQSNGYKPGMVSRGVGGKRQVKPYVVTAADHADEVGDEAILLRRAGCPLVLCVRRSAAIQYLLSHFDCDIVISDDGLQHYRMARDIEIVVIDGVRRFGNKQLLPAGPLREPITRLQHTNAVVVNGEIVQDDVQTMLTNVSLLTSMQLQVDTCIAIKDQRHLPLNAFIGLTVHAVAGIGHPERFFMMLEQAGLHVIRHTFPDHYSYQSVDLAFNDALPILMTEKDAVKCHDFADDRYWYVKISAKLKDEFLDQLLAQISQIKQKK